MIDNDGSENPATLLTGESRVQKQESSKLWLPVTAIAVVALTLLLLNLSESTLFPLSLKARDWTGFGGSTTEQATTSTELAPDGKTIIKTVVTNKKEDGKTLWDWLSVLGVPLTLALLGAWFQTRQQTQVDKKADLEKEIADTASKEEVIQAYLDRLSDLLIDKNLIAIAAKVQSFEAKSTSKKEGSGDSSEDLEEEVKLDETLQEQKDQLDAAVDVIRARTLAVLRRLKDDPKRKTSVMEFLIEAEVIQRLDLSLRGADLSRADLIDADLGSANLRGAVLIRANLSGANFIGADLTDADLSCAHLSGAVLIRAHLSCAHLSGAVLIGADLSCAHLTSSGLSGAQLIVTKLIIAQLSGANLSVTKLIGADLTFANLSGAQLIGTDLSGAQLHGADLSGAILLKADLRNVKELTQDQLKGGNPPLLCNVTLPKEIGVDSNRDCKAIPQALLKRYPEAFENLAEA